MPTISALLVGALVFTAVPISAQPEVIAAIQVHGNTLTAADQIVHASGLSEGAAFSESVRSDAEGRLRSLSRFDHVEVLKRYASISDASQILVVILVDEGPVRIERPNAGSPGQSPKVVRRGAFNVMFAPILDAEDGYGVTYGAWLSIAGHRNRTQRVIFPVSWGGDKRASFELQKEFSHRLAPHIRAGALVQRRTHPFFDADADRSRIWVRGIWPVVTHLRAAAEVSWRASTLHQDEHTMKSVGGEVILDTRVDPLLPRNAVYARATLARVAFPGQWMIGTELDATVYLGLYRGNVLAVRVLREGTSKPVPPDFKSILGGSRNLRGFSAGRDIGDSLMAGSAEIRMPLTSPLHMAKFGANVFIDAGTVYDSGQHFRNQTLKRGIGAGIWATAPLFHLSVSAAHGLGERTRVHFSAGLTF